MLPDDDDLLTELFAAELSRREAPPALHAWIEHVAPEHTPVPWHLAQLIALFERALREPIRAIVNLPPRHAKSTTVRRALAYATIHEPHRLNAFITYAADYAYTHSRAIRKLVRAHGGRLADDASNVKDWRTPEEGGLSATGIGGQLTGKGFGGLAVVDDPIKNRRDAESPLIRSRILESFNDDVFTRIEPGGSIVVVCTRWHEEDLAGTLERETDEEGRRIWEVLNLPAIRDPSTGEAADEGVALWPERFPVEVLARIRRKLGPYGWWSLYQQRPRPRDGKVFKAPARWSSLPEGLRFVLAVDPAGSARTKSNHTVAVAIGVKRIEGVLYGWLVGLVRLQLAPPDAAVELLAFQRRFGEALHIEASRDGVAQAQSLATLVPELSIELIAAVGDKYVRAQSLSSAWNGDSARGEGARFFVPAEAELIGCSREDLANYLRVMERFTGLGDVEDDDADATAHAWNTALATLDSDDAPTPPVLPPDDTDATRELAGFASRR